MANGRIAQISSPKTGARPAFGRHAAAMRTRRTLPVKSERESEAEVTARGHSNPPASATTRSPASVNELAGIVLTMANMASYKRAATPMAHDFDPGYRSEPFRSLCRDYPGT